MKDLIDSLAGTVVPGSVAARGVSRRPPAEPATGRRRRDRPLGKHEIEVLARVPLFAGLSRRHLRALTRQADLVEFHAGELVVSEGMQGGAFFAIVEGEATVTKGGRRVAALLPGDFFGELAVLDGGPRTASVVAATPMACIRVFKRAFDRLVADEPQVAAKILTALAGRLRQAERPVTG